MKTQKRTGTNYSEWCKQAEQWSEPNKNVVQLRYIDILILI